MGQYLFSAFRNTIWGGFGVLGHGWFEPNPITSKPWACWQPRWATDGAVASPGRSSQDHQNPSLPRHGRRAASRCPGPGQEGGHLLIGLQGRANWSRAPSLGMRECVPLGGGRLAHGPGRGGPQQPCLPSQSRGHLMTLITHSVAVFKAISANHLWKCSRWGTERRRGRGWGARCFFLPFPLCKHA